MRHKVDSGAERVVRDMLARAGLTVDGSAPWDPQVRDSRFYERVLTGSLGLGESYMDGWWECEQVDEMISRLLKAELDRRGVVKKTPELVLAAVKANVLNMQRRSRAYANVEHYDVGNDLFEAMLGPTMAYSCGYWKDATTLDEAQTAKFELIAQKLQVKPGDRVLDIGCGWGTLARHLAERHGAHVTGVTIAKEQAAYARKLNEGRTVEILLCDYRDAQVGRGGKFDKIVSVGMFEHVGVKNYRRYMEVAARHLTEEGLFLLHTIGACKSRTHGDAWLTRYYYPNGMLPSPANMTKATEDLFILEDFHSFGADYDKTLMEWHRNFEAFAATKWTFGPRAYRMWRYYLLMLAGSFRSRNKCQLWQSVFSKHGVPGGYVSIR